MSIVLDVIKIGKLWLGGSNLWLFLLLVLMILFGVNIGVVIWQGSCFVDVGFKVVDLQVLLQQLVNQGCDVVGGNVQVFIVFKVICNVIEQNVLILQGCYGKELGVVGVIVILGEIWVLLGKQVGQLVVSELVVLVLVGNVNNFIGVVLGLQVQLNELVCVMFVFGVLLLQVYSVLQQVVVVGLMVCCVIEMCVGGSVVVIFGDVLVCDIIVFLQVFDGLCNGNEELGIIVVCGVVVVVVLEQLQQKWEVMKQDVDVILVSLCQLFVVQFVVIVLGQGLVYMLDDSCKLFDVFFLFGLVFDICLFLNFWIGVVFGVFLLIVIIGFVFINVCSCLCEQELCYQIQVEFNSCNQQVIMWLLDEIFLFGEGDLMVKVLVIEDMIGVIVDVINYVVDELCYLVIIINDILVKVVMFIQEMQVIVMQLVEVVGYQVNQIILVLDCIGEIVVSIEQVLCNLVELVDVVQCLVVIVVEGVGVVCEIIQGMDQICDQIQEIFKCIKCLGELLQEIGLIVELINDIFEQINILVLNVVVQVVLVGEVGRGFVVVVDEVQCLVECILGVI